MFCQSIAQARKLTALQPEAQAQTSCNCQCTVVLAPEAYSNDLSCTKVDLTLLRVYAVFTVGAYSSSR